ncbi:MAG: methylated-DNA--[protein]-cysteine S-methyltransferase [Deltaproteobacteria bacterium]|nr:methylated-DNA--[protein]-cysteine S-methyltransferase [Deltaproteobacteria bacterium]
MATTNPAPFTLYYDSKEFPILGRIRAAATEKGICRITLPAQPVEDFLGEVLKKINPNILIQNKEIFIDLYNQLEEYLSGGRRDFSLPLDLRGTPFQLQVWEALSRIPFGETRSYRDIAVQIGRPRAVRAVGQANHGNPVPLIIPCHRVIGADGDLTGYGGGISLKKQLLALEEKIH